MENPPVWLDEAPPPVSAEDYGNVLPFPLIVDDPIASLETIDLATIPVEDVEPRRWIVPDLVPDRNVTDLAGDGGLGKSLLALQLGIAMTSGRDWLGSMPTPGGFLYISCEDERDEIMRRRNAVLAGMNLAPHDLAAFHLVDLTDAEGTELAMSGQHGVLELTALYRRLEAAIATLRPKCVALDTRADVFGGNEISRIQVRSFVRSLRRLAIRYDLAILMLSHPSVSGMATGSGQSGSTGWGNSVRSRLYLTAPKADGGSEPDPDIRILSNKKANYGPRGTEIVLKWDRGMFRPDGGALNSFDRETQEKRIERRFMELLEEREHQGRTANASSGPNYAPSVLSKMDGTITKIKFAAAMERLLKSGDVENVQFNRSRRLVLTDKGLAAIRVPF